MISKLQTARSSYNDIELQFTWRHT